MDREINKILCWVNLRQAADEHPGYEAALELAKQHGAEMIVVTVAPEIERNLNIHDSEKVWGDQLARFLQKFPPGDVNVRPVFRKGVDYREIVKLAKSEEVDLIVMPWAHPRIRDYVFGTTASHVVAYSPCSVHVVR